MESNQKKTNGMKEVKVRIGGKRKLLRGVELRLENSRQIHHTHSFSTLAIGTRSTRKFYLIE